MAEQQRSMLFQDLPSDVILEVLISGGFRVTDLINLELTSKKLFGRNDEACPDFKSVADHAAFRLCSLHPIFVRLSSNHQKELLERCSRNWKRVLRFLRSCQLAEITKDKKQIITGDDFTLINNSNSKVFSCEARAFWYTTAGPINLPFSPLVMQVTARHDKYAFVLHSGEVFSCGRGESGPVDANHPMVKAKLVEALKMTPCKQVSVGIDFTVFLSREGHVYTVGQNRFGQLGHGDTKSRQIPQIVEMLKKIATVVQISAGPSYVLALTDDGSVYSFGYGKECLGDGSLQHKLQPQVIQTFQTKRVHILSVSAGNEHAAAIDSNGYVYTWGRRNRIVIGSSEPVIMATPKVRLDLKDYLVGQICAANRTLVVVDESGSVFSIT